ncbi:MAG: DUF1045 domain-containing protein [Janthinobacterium lividum]
MYLSPAGAWSRLGQRWLGRDADTGERIERSLGSDARAQGREELIEQWTEAPRHYGLHATLKPPFRLGAGTSAAQLDASVRALAQSTAPFELRLRLERLRGFMAWCAAADTPGHAQLLSLANDCVARLDHFRALPGAAELARRRGGGLLPAQDANLVRWGYPYVFDTFTFHITLTRRLDDATLDAAQAALGELAQLHGEPLGCAGLASSAVPSMPVRQISVFVQPDPDAPFVVARHYGFDGSTRDGIGAAWMKP